MLPLLLFSSARAGVPVTPLNYRLSADGLRELIDRLPTPLVIADAEYVDVVAGAGKQVIVLGRVHRVGPHRRAGGRVRRPRRRRRRAVHLRHHLAAQGRRADAQQPDQLRHRHRRVRVGGAGGRGIDLRAAVSHRRCERGAVQSVRGPKDGVPDQVRRRRMGPPGRRDEGVTIRDRGADDARPHRLGARSATRPTLPTLRTLAYGGSKVALPLGAQGLELLPERGFRQRLRPHRDQFDHRRADTRRPPRRACPPPTTRPRAGSGRSVNRYPASRCRSAPTTAPSSAQARPGELFVRGEQVSGRYTEHRIGARRRGLVPHQGRGLPR